MALTQTTLTASITNKDLVLSLTSTTGFASGQLVKVDGEYMFVDSVPSTTSLIVRNRGSAGTEAVAHNVGAYVVTSTAPSDFPTDAPGNVRTLGETQTLADLPNSATNYLIDKATAATITLPTPSKAKDGLVLRFSSTTAAAHVVSAASLIADAVSGSPHGTATFAAFKGSSLTLMVANGLYNVIGAVGITVT